MRAIAGAKAFLSFFKQKQRLMKTACGRMYAPVGETRLQVRATRFYPVPDLASSFFIAPFSATQFCNSGAMRREHSQLGIELVGARFSIKISKSDFRFSDCISPGLAVSPGSAPTTVIPARREIWRSPPKRPSRLHSKRVFLLPVRQTRRPRV